MNYVSCIFLTFIFDFVLFCPVHTNEICDLNDQVCLRQAINVVYKKAIAGEPCGITTSDPLFLAESVGTMLCTTYLITNATLTGLKNCKLTKAMLNGTTMRFEQTLTCPKLVVDYYYAAEGSINEAELNGGGYGILTTGVYEIMFTGTFGQFISKKDQKNHLYVKSYSVDSRAVERLVLESDDLNQDDEKAQEALDYLNENWEIMAKYFKSPVFEDYMAILMNNLNCCIKKLTRDEVLAKVE